MTSIIQAVSASSKTFVSRKVFVLLCIFLIPFFIYSQAVGDYRSAGGGGNWSTLASWQRCNSIGPAVWAVPTALQGYPGELAVSGNVNCRVLGGAITLNVSPANNIGSLTVGFVGGLSTSGNNNLTVNGNLQISLGGSFTFGGTGNISIGGTTSVGIGASFTDNDGTGTSTFTGGVTISAGGSWTTTAITTTGNLIFKGGITNNSGTFSGGGATFNTNAQALTGAGAISFANIVTVTVVTVTNNGTVNMTNTGAGILTGTGTWTQGTGAYTLNYTGSTITVNTFNASGAGNIVNYNSASPQTIKNVTYDNLTVSGGGLKTLAGATIVNTLFTMTSGNVDLAANTMTIGSAAVTPGALSYSAGVIYGGTLTRWFNTPAVTLGNTEGHFPLGSSAGDYRPLWIGSSAGLSGGTVSASHSAVYPANTNTCTPVLDVSWTYSVLATSQSGWTVSTLNGFSFTGATGQIRYGGQNLGTCVPGDINASLSGGAVVGNHSAATGSPEVNRIGLNTGELANTWYIGTKDLTVSPLPVDFLSFDATPNGKVIGLDWSTALEFNSDYFMVQRSQDGSLYEDVTQVKAAGNSSTVKEYSAADTDPYSEESYYRLKQVDLDGKIIFSNVVVVSFSTKEGSLIFPNPSSGLFNIYIPGSQGEKISITITDILGNELYSNYYTNDNEIAINLSKRLAPGVYFLAVKAARISWTHKLIID